MKNNHDQEPAFASNDGVPPDQQQELDETFLALDAGQRVHVVFERDWYGAALELSSNNDSGDDFAWALPEDLNVGDIVMTAVGRTNPFFICIERVQELGDATYMSPRDAFFTPVLVESLENASGFEITDGDVLSGHAARKLLGTLKRMIDSQEPIEVEVPECGRDFNFADWSYVMATRILQHEILAKRNSCAGCGTETGKLEPHSLERFVPGATVELHQLVTALELLCSTCHEFFHGSSMELLNRLRRPVCPECGASNPKEYRWGMQPPPLDEDEYVMAGCCVPDGPWPQWLCRECGASYSVISIPEGGYLHVVGADGKPLLRY